jgi:hypothetical protein
VHLFDFQIHFNVDTSSVNYWLRLLVREWAQFCIFLYIGYVWITNCIMSSLLKYKQKHIFFWRLRDVVHIQVEWLLSPHSSRWMTWIFLNLNLLSQPFQFNNFLFLSSLTGGRLGLKTGHLVSLLCQSLRES